MRLTALRRFTSAALAVVMALALPLSSDGAAKKKKRAPAKSKSRKSAPAQPSTPVATGTTLEARVASLMNSSTATSSTSSLEVVELESGRVIAQRNSALPVAPASNMKLFTTAAALELLDPGFEFVTTVSILGQVDSTGTLDGDVKITGRGDPTLGGRFHDGNATAVMEDWARELQRAGIRSIRGNLIFEHGYFDEETVHPTWPEDQLTNWYEAPIAALSAQEGCVLVRVLPGRPGGPAVVQFEPKNTFLALQNQCKTGRGRGVFIARARGTNQIIVRGSVPARSGPTEVFVTVMHPVHYFGNVTHQAFLRSGLRLLGEVQLTPRDSRLGWKTVTQHRTPLSIVNFVINKKSQNHYAEQLLKTIGAEVRSEGSWSAGSAAITDWMTSKVGVSSGEFRQIDGSGMSRFNRASANSFVSLLRFMWKTPHRRDFVSSMPFSGEDDTRLRRRLNRAPYARQVYAKTGYISGVIGLSGYVQGKSGKVYAFSFLFNGYRTGVWAVYRLQDEMLKEIIERG